MSPVTLLGSSPLAPGDEPLKALAGPLAFATTAPRRTLLDLEHTLDGRPTVLAVLVPIAMDPCNDLGVEPSDALRKERTLDRERTRSFCSDGLRVDRSLLRRRAAVGSDVLPDRGLEMRPQIEVLALRVELLALQLRFRGASGLVATHDGLSHRAPDVSNLTRRRTDASQVDELVAGRTARGPAEAQADVRENVEVDTFDKRLKLRLGIGDGEGLLAPVVAHHVGEHGLGLADPLHIATRDVLHEPAPGVLAAPGLNEEGIGRPADLRDERVARIPQLALLALHELGSFAVGPSRRFGFGFGNTSRLGPTNTLRGELLFDRNAGGDSLGFGGHAGLLSLAHELRFFGGLGLELPLGFGGCNGGVARDPHHLGGGRGDDGGCVGPTLGGRRRRRSHRVHHDGAVEPAGPAGSRGDDGLTSGNRGGPGTERFNETGGAVIHGRPRG